MGHRTVAQFANQSKRVLSPTRLNDLGRRVGFCHRERLITPYRLVLSLLASHATETVETLADNSTPIQCVVRHHGRVQAVPQPLKQGVIGR